MDAAKDMVIQTGGHIRTNVVITEWHTLEARVVPTLVDPIAAKLERLEAKPSLVIDDVDYAVRNRDEVRARCDDPGAR